MSTAWSPSIRDTATGGLAALLIRKSWRDSDAGPAIATLLSAAMRDANPVVRMRAAEAALAMHASIDAAKRAAAIGELVLAEENPTARAVLLHQLTADAGDAPETVDAVLERLFGADDGAMPDPAEDLGHGVMVPLTYLALVPQAPFASRIVERWCRDAPTHAAAVKAFAQCARPYLAPSPRDGQQAYRLLDAAAKASLARWTRDPNEHLAAANLSDEQLAELRGAAEVAHTIAQQLYFASGAFDAKQGQEPPARGDLATFADLAFPVLTTCAGLRIPQCIHRVVQTMIFVAPLNEARALQAVAEAVPSDGPYAGDSLAGADVIPYLERLLAEQRPLVLFDEDGVAAFRHLLAAFAAAGNEAALALAYTFADVFR